MINALRTSGSRTDDDAFKKLGKDGLENIKGD